jgi:phytanoyl-CoA hydroxylase
MLLGIIVLLIGIALSFYGAYRDPAFLIQPEGGAAESKNYESSIEPLVTAPPCGIRIVDSYLLCSEQKQAFFDTGLSILPGLLSAEELSELADVYGDYMRDGSPEKQGRDFCDMSKPYDTPRENYSVINAMLPRRYYPQLQGNVYERVAASVAAQLFPEVDMVLDYDQLLDKAPGAKDAVFPWHQDMAYWPNTAMTPDTRTVTFSLALDATSRNNGCIRYVPGSGLAKTLRPHLPAGKDKDDTHAVAAEVGEEEEVRYAEVSAGSVSIHDEYVVHGSGGNLSNGPRRTYVVAFRTRETVARERAAGFTHSHNDETNWDVFNDWKRDG